MQLLIIASYLQFVLAAINVVYFNSSARRVRDFPIDDIVQNLDLPEEPDISKDIFSPILGKGLIVIKSKTSSKVYVGRSNKMQRRIGEYIGYIREGLHTVGRNFTCGNYRVYSIGNVELTDLELRYYKQKLMNVITSQGYNHVYGKIEMNSKQFKKMEKIMEEE